MAVFNSMALLLPNIRPIIFGYVKQSLIMLQLLLISDGRTLMTTLIHSIEFIRAEIGVLRSWKMSSFIGKFSIGLSRTAKRL